MAIDTVNDALEEAIRIKGQIRAAIISKDVAVPENTPFADYPSKVSAIAGHLQTKSITPTAAGGTVSPDTGYDGFSSVTLPAEPNLIPANISEGVSIFGVVGTAPAATFDISAFFARTLTSLSLGVATIGEYMFYNYTALRSFTDTSLTELGRYAFQNCTGLQSFVASSSLTRLKNYVFSGCQALATLDLSHITQIDDYALQNCKAVANIGTLHASKIGSYGAYYLGSNASTGFIYNPDSEAEIGTYGLQYAKITEIRGVIKSVGDYGLANLPSVFTTFSGRFTGAIGNYGFSNNQYLRTVNFATSDVTSIGTYAFYYLGWNRTNYSTERMTLDFRNSSFGTIQNYAFGYIRYADIYMPASVTQINAYAFRYCQYVNIYMGDAPAPTLSANTAFNNTTSYKVFVPWGHVASYQTGTNWTAIAANVVGYAPAGTFTAGDTLPAYNAEGYALTWYSDVAKTTVVTTCPAGSPVLYCAAGSTKVKEVIHISASGPITITVTDSNDDPVDISLGYVLCESGDVFNVSASTTGSNVCYIKVDGVKVTTFPYTLTVGSSDIDIKGTAYDPTAVNPDYYEATWREIKNAVDTGVAATLYAEYLGAQKTVQLKNGQTVHVRLMNNTTDMYEYADGNGTTGFVLAFDPECFATAYYMNSTNTNVGGWNASYMRTTVMPLIFNQLPDDLQEVIATVKIKAAGTGTESTVLESNDTLFLPAEREIFASRTYSRQEEWNALTRWQYYAQNDTAAARIKTLNNSANNWWERSPYGGNTTGFCIVSDNGNASSGTANNSYGVAPGFCI